MPSASGILLDTLAQVSSMQQLLCSVSAIVCFVLLLPAIVLLESRYLTALWQDVFLCSFSRASLSQYTWHFTPEQMEKVSVYIPMSAINVENVNFLEVLRKVSKEEIAEKQALIRELAPRLQYSIVPERIGNGSDGRTWKPFKDAQEVIIEKILDRKTVEPIKGFTDEQILEMLEKQNYIMSTSEDYAALRRDKPGQKPKYKRKREIAPGLKGVSKIMST